MIDLQTDIYGLPYQLSATIIYSPYRFLQLCHLI